MGQDIVGRCRSLLPGSYRRLMALSRGCRLPTAPPSLGERSIHNGMTGESCSTSGLSRGSCASFVI